MPILEDLKRTTEHLTGWHRPEPAQLDKLVRTSKAAAYSFLDDGLIPNNRWPVIIYRGAVRFPRALDPAAVIEDIFERNGWGDSWRDGIYDYLHYHSRIHEVLGVARGSARVRLGGEKGRTFKIAAGDILILPAGTGHQSLKASKNFLVVGAYPSNGTYDECLPARAQHAAGAKPVKKVGLPRKDPVFGAGVHSSDTGKPRANRGPLGLHKKLRALEISCGPLARGKPRINSWAGWNRLNACVFIAADYLTAAGARTRSRG